MPGTLVNRRLAKDTFDTGASSGTQTITHPLMPMDFSHCEALRLELSLTTADTDAIDILDIKLQFLNSDAITWETRARFPQFLGTLSPSSTAPESYVMTLNQIVPIQGSEESFEPSGSAGASEPAAGTVINGPFPGIVRTSAGRTANARLVYVITDADSDARFAGSLAVVGLTRA